VVSSNQSLHALLNTHDITHNFTVFAMKQNLLKAAQQHNYNVKSLQYSLTVF